MVEPYQVLTISACLIMTTSSHLTPTILADIERLMTLKRLRKVIETALTHTLSAPATGFLDLPECEQRREQEGVGLRGEDGTPGT